MQKEALETIIMNLGASAAKAGLALGPQQLFLACIDRRQARQPDANLAAAKTAIAALLRYLEKKEPENKEIVATFDANAVVAQCLAFAANKPALGDHDLLLWWLLDSEFDDAFTWFAACRRLCHRNHVTPAIFLGAIGTPAAAGVLGFGHFVEPDRASATALIGREADLERHLGLLRLALLRNRHYLITGEGGVGKTIFLQAMLERAQARFSAETDARLSKRRFLLVRAADLMTDAEGTARRMRALFDLLARDLTIVAAIDDVETCLEPALPGATAFRDAVGYQLLKPQRSLILVSSTVAARKDDMLRTLPTHPLPALDAASTGELITRRLHELCGRMPVPLTPEPSAASLAAEILAVGREHYAGRHFPEIALHLAEGMVERAEGRVTYFQRPPLGHVTADDLRALVSEELGIAPETLGKDPAAFYADLERKLAARIIGQDHAVKLVTKVLATERRIGSSNIPRGRFLFVGPPGVGKTHLSRSLAQGLGYDQDAFMAVNMSDYSTDGARTRFIGADPGYIGYGASRTIYDVARSRPSCVILLDEIDRAHASIQDILLSVLEGRGNNANGEEIQFSQAIFILTTNLGQEQVESAYRHMQGQGRERHEIAAAFDDHTLRELILAGAVDRYELDRMRELDARIEAIRAAPESDLTSLDDYLALKSRRRALELVRRHASLDRAFLDRIDFIIPFFPVDDRDDIARVVRLKLDDMGWSDCPPAVVGTLVDEVAKGGSIRMIERLIKRQRIAG